jgi:dUTP pyrophosphatase
MKPLNLKIKCHHPNMPMPKKAHLDDSGLDLSLIKVIQKRSNIFFFDTGISVEPPTGYYTELVPRSSIYKQDFIMTNSIGIIDQGYRGLIMMPMRYVGNGNGLAAAEKLIGERIGQLILKQLIPFQIKICDELSETQRGEGGFGSSGS